MIEDKEAIKYSLKGIIKCKKLLGEDYTLFQKEYESYHFLEDNKKNNKLVKKIPIRRKNIAKSEKQKRKKQKIVEEEKIVPLPRYEELVKSQNIISSSQIVKRDINILKDIKIKKNVIKLIFNKNLKDKDITFYELNYKKKFRHIYDIKAILSKDNKKNLSIKNLQKIKLSQHNKEKIRLILENPTKFKSKAYFNKNKIIIAIENISFLKRIKERFAQKSNSNKTIKKYIKKSHKVIKKYSKSIVIDPGHGGSDSGAVGYNGFQEKKAVLAIGLKLRKILQKRGYKVYMTRDRDKTIKIQYRPKVINRTNADLLISIHANSLDDKSNISVRGIETYYLSPADSPRAKRVLAKEDGMLRKTDKISQSVILNFINREKINRSKYLGIDIQTNVISALRKKYSGIVDHGVRPAGFWVLSAGKMPGILIEVGYITNPTEAKRLFNPFYQKTLAEGIANGIDSYFLKN